MRSYITNHLTIALLATLSAILIGGSAWYIHDTFSDIEMRLMSDIEHRQKTLGDLAVVTDRNGADSLTERIVTDCPKRTEFENLLNGLGTASRKELLNAQVLFESCGSFYAERKALMVAQLEREYQSLQLSLALLGEVRDLNATEKALTRWEALIELEKTRSSFLNEQTNIQSEIIVLLIQGESQSRINELVRQAQSIGESLNVTDAQIDEIRSALLS